MKKNVSRSEAHTTPFRRYFSSKIHHRIIKATSDAGIPAAVAENPEAKKVG